MPPLEPRAEDDLQNAHTSHLAKLHEEGLLLAAGPLLGPPDRRFRGLSIYRGPVDEARAGADRDPAVVAGRYPHRFFPWLVPKGTLSFAPTRFPRSLDEVG